MAAMRSPRRTADHCAPIGGWLPTGCNVAMTLANGIAGRAVRPGEVHNRAMERLFGAAAAIVTWVGWMAICPALGFPILGTAAMINRAFFKQIPDAGHQPNFWIGWTILIAGLAGAIAVFFILERRRLLRASIRTGLIYGVLLWLVVGAVIMPVFGFFEARPPAAPGFQPADPMQATFMMYSLGPLAAAAALIAWLLFGAILGATWSEPGKRESAPVPRTAR